MPAPVDAGFPSSSPELPVFVEAVLDPKPWGSRNLARFGLELPAGETIGEALFTAPQSRVITGSYSGLTLGELALRDPATWIGANGLAATQGRQVFPLMVKIIDAQQDLSIQVHPTDALATVHGVGLGKTEAWHILAAEPESIIYLGLSHATAEAAFALACRDGSGASAALLRQIPARPGATYIVPAGTPHAIGANVVIYEIQQPSTITYRLDDWGRLDASGTPRPLHIEAGLEALDGSSRPEPVPEVVLQHADPRRELLAATRYFALERIKIAVGQTWILAPVESPQVLTLQQGVLQMTAGHWSETLIPWQTLVAPVGCELKVIGQLPGILLRGWVPDLAHDVLAPARIAGIPEDALSALGVHIGG